MDVFSSDHPKQVVGQLGQSGNLPHALADSDGAWRIWSSPVFVQYWQAALRWRVLVAIILFSAIVLSIAVALLTPPLYEASTLIEVSREQKNITSVQGLEGNIDGRDAEFYETQYALLRSVSLAERVARSLRLADSNEFWEAHGIDASERDFESQLPAADARERELQSAATLLLKNLEISPVPRSRLIEVAYTSRSPIMSAAIANAWGKEFIGATMDRQIASSADARKFLENRLEQLRKRIDDSERGLVRYANANDIVTLDTVRGADGKTFLGRTLVSSDLEALNEALTKAKADRIAAQSRLNKAGMDTSAEALESQVIANLRAKRAEIDSEYARMLVQFAPNYPPALALKNQRDALDRAIENEVRRISEGRRLAYAEALARERDLQTKVDSLVSDLNKQREASIQQSIFQRDADTNRQLYDALLQRYKEIGVAGSIGASNIAIVDTAKVPTRPSWPILILNLGLGIVGGVVLAAAAVFALEQIDEGIRNPEDVKSLLNVPLLGNIPLSDVAPLDALADAKSPISEAYFSARSTLSFATNHGLPSTLAITSTMPGEGKSTTSFSLATIIARTGKRVLLIDGDLRSPSLHEFAGVNNKAGLSNLLTGEELSDHVHAEVQRNLSLLTTGPMPPNPAELLSGERFSILLEALSKHYDHIMVDLPPVLGLADVLLMGRVVEGVVYVVQAERTPRRAIRTSFERLRSAHINVFGVIVSQVDLSKHKFGYGYGYGYGYTYGYGESDTSKV